MKNYLYLLSIIISMCFISAGSFGQFPLTQYFDGYDTIPGQSVFMIYDTSASNIWQVGPPQKALFNSAASTPNALMTDTVNNYPVNNQSIVSYKVNSMFWPFGILAIQWMQKLDMEQGKDGGIIEYSSDSGNTWHNVFNNPFVYNFYGFNPNNADTLPSGDFAFSGTDATWKNIWLCFDISWLNSQDTLIIRHRFVSDSVQTNQEGWMIDNLWVNTTIIHTIGEVDQKEPILVYPKLTDGIVNIQVRKADAYHIIENLEVIDVSGKAVQQYRNVPTRFFVDLKNHPPGNYIVRVKTNLEYGAYPVVLSGNKN
jgi:hypothetical protein